VEIMIVVVIMGLLAGVVTLSVRSYMDRARVNTARNEIATIRHALETFYATYGRYPSNDEGLEALTKSSEKLPAAPLEGDLVDPWGNAYQYNSPGREGPYEVICYGADGREGGDGIDSDITSDDLKE